MRQLIIFFCSVLMFLESCDNNQLDISDVSPPIEIGHFDHAFFSMDSASFDQDLLKLIKQYPSFFKVRMDEDMLRNRFFDHQIRELHEAVDSIFSDTKQLDHDLYTAFQYFYHLFPNHDSLKIYTWVSNFERLDPILVSENTILVALDMYLGAQAHFYKTAPDFIKQGFDKNYILSDLFQAYFSSNIPSFDNHSLLASMVYYGKIYYLSSLILPNEEAHVIMGYTQDKMKWCFKNEGNIWAYFIENKLLFSSNQQNKMRFIEDAPFSKFYTSFDKQSPGRVGQWIGYKIVATYIQSHPNLSVIDLIQEQDAQKILRQSRYKPKK